MINPEYVTIIFTSIAFLLFAFLYWRDSTSEGFSSDKILDSFFIILIGGILGGKILFRELDFDYFRYQILNAPLILEGVLVGGAIAAYTQIKRNNWEGWKIGDMIAPALAAFQAVVFLGIWVRIQTLSQLFIFIGFTLLYFIIRILKKGYYLGTTTQYFRLRRLNKLTFTGGLFALYLTGSSLIAMLFLATHYNLESRFWLFQMSFYLTIFAIAWILISKRLRSQGVQVKSFLPSTFIQRVKSLLNRKEEELKENIEDLNEKDPFIQEVKSDGFRNIDEEGDEVAESREHDDIEALKDDVEEELEEVEDALESIEKGEYGICKNCGKQIDQKRLEAYPTAQYCVDCKEDIESSNPAKI